MFHHIPVVSIGRKTYDLLICTQISWHGHGTTNMKITYGQHQSYKLHVNKKCSWSVQLNYSHLVTLKTYFYKALQISLSMKLLYDLHLSYPNQAKSINAFLRMGTIGICPTQTSWRCFHDFGVWVRPRSLHIKMISM